MTEEKTRKYLLCCGRRTGKSRLTYHTIVEMLPVSKEEKKKLHEEYEKALRGEK